MKVREAFDMAIEALSAEAVSREFYEDAVKANHGLAKENSELKKQIESADRPSGDLISRADAIEAIESRQTEQWIDADVDYNNGLESAVAEIKALPSADRPHGEWILCSERLPEDGQGIIICTDDKRFKDHPVGTCIYEDGGFHTSFHDDISIIAWMPLPKPYCPNCGADMRKEK